MEMVYPYVCLCILKVIHVRIWENVKKNGPALLLPCWYTNTDKNTSTYNLSMCFVYNTHMFVYKSYIKYFYTLNLHPVI